MRRHLPVGFALVSAFCFTVPFCCSGSKRSKNYVVGFDECAAGCMDILLISKGEICGRIVCVEMVADGTRGERYVADGDI